jgi:lactose/L-arabinose transport system substrate-binding protein
LELGITVKEATGMPLISAVSNEVDTVAFMLQSAGTWFFDEQGNTSIQNNPVVRRAVELYYNMVDAGVILEVADWNAYIATINNGTVAGTISGCWIIGSISSQPAQSGLWAMTNIPRFGTVPSANYSSWGGSSWMVLASSPNADLAVEFLRATFAGSAELYQTILPVSGAIATWLPAADAPAYAEPSEFFGRQRIFGQLLEYAANVPRVKYGVFNYEARDAVGRAISEIIRGAPIDDALATAQRNVEFLISQAQ